ncbi:ANTAR domain-containing protein [Kineococcus rhizosphaerae]|uniref:ANTAR domain-containing protein n=1 Tax=Kineococcus rhizosphaerae TaxID=559628 RepID=A0A2T0R325_9ACTN|nr:ANTAR domain-containing protein [Kineococcus rhizosphaerae]PRY14452.1 ANTAR domain-containing protein [Kineococcus rhizosphaerae]
MHDGSRRLDGAREGQHEDGEALLAEVTQLRTALTRRPVIDMAKGAIMALTRCDEDTAFRQLSEVSQTHNVKLFDLASALLGDLQRPDPGTSEVDRLVQQNWTRR